MLRLGFHDCLTYSGDIDADEINGCDGCLNPVGMNQDNLAKFDTWPGLSNGPNVNITDNNGLTMTADLLEEIYTNRKFPKKTTALPVSMKDSGKSRADLWAFATILSVQVGINYNNMGCDGITP